MAKTKSENYGRRPPRPKTPAQEAKKRANIKAAEARLKRLQAKQRQEVAEQRQRSADHWARVEHERQQAQFQKDYVEAALNGPAQFPLKRWLANRQPTFQRVHRFFDQRPELPQPFEEQPDAPKAA